MISHDWRDALGALRQNLGPEDISTEQLPMAAEESQQTGRLDILFERKGRGGKTATIVSGFSIPDEEIEYIASEMKKKLGAGGSARGGEILIQGDRRTDVLKFLTSKGLKARII